MPRAAWKIYALSGGAADAAELTNEAFEDRVEQE